MMNQMSSMVGPHAEMECAGLDTKLLMALANDDDVEVMHHSDKGDHRWRPNRQEKAKLLNHIGD
jgi:hypothetical protein